MCECACYIEALIRQNATQRMNTLMTLALGGRLAAGAVGAAAAFGLASAAGLPALPTTTALSQHSLI